MSHVITINGSNAKTKHQALFNDWWQISHVLKSNERTSLA